MTIGTTSKVNFTIKSQLKFIFIIKDAGTLVEDLEINLQISQGYLYFDNYLLTG